MKSVPVSVNDVRNLLEHVKDERGENYVVRWSRPVEFTDWSRKRSVWFGVSQLGDVEARRRAWDSSAWYLAYARGGGEGRSQRFGPISHEHVDEGRGEMIRYHGNQNHEFVVHNWFEELETRVSAGN